MSAKLVVTLLATSLLTVGCVAYTDDPYYRGGYGYHDHDDDRCHHICIYNPYFIDFFINFHFDSFFSS
mgnify:CR=1 FL=1